MVDSHLIDGTAIAAQLRAGLKTEVAHWLATKGLVPKLVVVIVGEDPASQVYVRNKAEQSKAIGMESETIKLPVETTESDLLALVAKLNADSQVNGILVQLHLPAHMSSLKVIDAIDPDKDVDGFHVINAGKLSVGLDGIVPCTPLGSMILLEEAFKPFNDSFSGKHAVIVGRSNIVGKPMAQLLLAKDCTVTIAHSKTKGLAALCQSADILVAAVGRPRFIKGEWVKDGAYIIDVGINRITDGETTKLVGDVDFDAAKAHARAITPVPKGVGPMTIACLLKNTLTAFCRQHGLSMDKAA